MNPGSKKCFAGERGGHWKLDTIPIELFLHICSFLSAKFVIQVLSQVCQQFKNVIQDDTTWRTRISERWPKKYPIIKADIDFNWKEACIQREEQYTLWSNKEVNMKFYTISGAHYAPVDVVLLLKGGELCVSGSRDRSLKIWSISALSQSSVDTTVGYRSALCDVKPEAHTGWIWSMANKGNFLYSGGWDKTVRQWDLQDCNKLSSTFLLSSPVLCLAFSENLLAAGCYDRIVSVFDPRAGVESIMHHSCHKNAVLCLAADDKFIISGSEDGSVVIFDKVARKILKAFSLEYFPMCISYEYHHLWVGDKLGFIHLVDPTNEKFNIIRTYSSGHVNGLTGLHYSLGVIVTCSRDKTIGIHEPSADPKRISTLFSSEEVAGISFLGTTLVSAVGDSVSVWMPNQEAQRTL